MPAKHYPGGTEVPGTRWDVPPDDDENGLKATAKAIVAQIRIMKPDEVPQFIANALQMAYSLGRDRGRSGW